VNKIILYFEEKGKKERKKERKCVKSVSY